MDPVLVFAAPELRLPPPPVQVDLRAGKTPGLCTCTCTLPPLHSAACLRVPSVSPQEIPPPVVFAQCDAETNAHNGFYYLNPKITH